MSVREVREVRDVRAVRDVRGINEVLRVGLMQLPVTRTGAPETLANNAARLGLTSLPPELLPPELLAMVIAMINTDDDPCKAVQSLCMSNRQWAGWCRDDLLFDAINSALGYYGAQMSFPSVRAYYNDIGVTPAATPKKYFQQACCVRSDIRRDVENLKDVPTYRVDYLQILTLAVQTNGWALKHVPKDRADYGELAKLAVTNYGRALRYVPKTREDFGAIAKLAMESDGRALGEVPTTREDFRAIAKLAIINNHRAIRHVPKDHADYFDLLKMSEVVKMVVETRRLHRGPLSLTVSL